MAGSALPISVVIRTYTEERWDYLATALASLARQSARPQEIIVVVDHNAGLLARVGACFPGVVVVENRGPQGSSGAWNSGIAAARGQIIAFLDDDAEAAPDWLAQLYAGYAQDVVAGVGGAIHPLWQGGERPRWFPEEFDWVVGCTYRGMPETPAPVRNLLGCNMSFRRQVFAALGGFRAGLGHIASRPLGDDETELCIRLGQRWPSRVLLHNPQARVGHRVSASRARWRYFYARCALEGRSKARLARLVGRSDGLSSERAHAFRTLPRGVLRGLADCALRRDLSGLARAWAITSGLAVTVAGYLAGTIAGYLAGSQPADDGAVLSRLGWWLEGAEDPGQ